MELVSYGRPNFLQRGLQRFATTPIGVRILTPILFRIDNWLMRRSNGRLSLATTVAGLPPTAQLTSVGARSGKPRTAPLTAWPTRDNQFILVADNFGKPRNPGWYHNLRANPRATIFREGETIDVVAEELSGRERDRAWQHASAHFLGYERFLERRGGRAFPVLLLKPAESERSVDNDGGFAVNQDHPVNPLLLT